jgi:trigger factor
MNYTLQQGPASNYLISVDLTKADLATYKETVLKGFQKDIKVAGFRPGHVPLAMVEQQVNPMYIEMGVIEEGVNASIQQVIAEHKDLSFIGQIYDLDRKDNDDITTVSYKLDVYPQITAKNDTWKSMGLFPVNPNVSTEELEDSFKNLQRQYADYQEASMIGDGTVAKVKFSTKNSQGNEVDKGSLFLGDEEYTEFPALKEWFYGKTTADTVTLDYNESQLPVMFHCKSKDVSATTIEVSISDIKAVKLPKFTPEEIKKFFGEQDDVKTVEDLKAKIANIMLEQKKSHDLAHSIEHLLADAKDCFSFVVPKTLVDEEVKTRVKSLEERMGGEKGLEKYYEQIGEEATAKMKSEIQDAASQSLSKFFVLKAIVDGLGLQVNRDAAGDVEQKIYDAMPKTEKPHVH